MSNIRFFDTVDSTNTLAKDYLNHGDVIIASKQTKGRGRHGNTWVSDTGNLYMSIIWQVKDLKVASYYSFITAVAVANTIEELSNKKLELKWPNDILLTGKKLAGILLETSQNKDNELFLIIGIGVNLKTAPNYAIALDTDISNIDMCKKIMHNFKLTSELFEKKGIREILSAWKNKSYGMGKKINVRLSTQIKTGIFKDIDENGALVLEKSDGNIEYINSGEVFFDE